jgi:lipopolysaccharide export system permease protein
MLTIAMTMLLVRMVSQASKGFVSPQDVFLLLGLVTLSQLPVLLSISLFLAILQTLGRIWKDSEMVIWNSAGLGLRAFALPVVRMAWPVLVCIAALVFMAVPWVQTQTDAIRARYTERSDIARVKPGKFEASRDGRSVFFIDQASTDTTQATGVFMWNQTDQGEVITTAQSGWTEAQEDGRYLILKEGHRSENQQPDNTYTHTAFTTATVRLSDAATQVSPIATPEKTSSLSLWNDPSPPAQSELTRRLGMVLASFNLLLLGIGLSAHNPRKPSSWNLIFALLSFMAYFNLFNLMATWVAKGWVSMSIGLVGLHGGVGLLAVGLFYWRDQALGLRRWLPWPLRTQRKGG